MIRRLWRVSDKKGRAFFVIYWIIAFSNYVVMGAEAAHGRPWAALINGGLATIIWIMGCVMLAFGAERRRKQFAKEAMTRRENWRWN